MRGIKIAIGLLLIASAGGLAAQQWPRTSDDLVVHEWGTFLAMSGSDGVALDGMYHEEHALPAFVHARSRDQLRLPSVILKGETPVIYFYTDRAQKVRVDVRFPTGLWTQWYPQAQVVGPQFSQAQSPMALRDGRIRWCAEIVPAREGAAKIPPTSSDALWNFARQVDAAYVRTKDGTKEGNPPEYERFLFYRGLGTVPLPIQFGAEAGGTLESTPGDRHGAREVFVLRVEGGKGTYTWRPRLAPGERLTGVIPSMDEAMPLAKFTEHIAKDLEGRLIANGLYDKEAEAMVNTWRTSYFHTEGVRALFVMPQQWTDEFIPLTVEPKPAKTVRVMVGRIELLTPARERQAEDAVRVLASPDADARSRAFAFLREQGRYVEPILRRVLATTGDEKVKPLCRQLLATDFVTELRAAIHDAADGRRTHDDPVHIRAQLASLLREIGLDAEARAEGEKVVAELKSRPAPPMTDPDSRQYLRAYARALEGIGDERSASEWYGRFIRFGSQVGTIKECRGCHRDAGPRDLTWFRDWWAGRRYAAHASRDGGVDRAIAERQAALANNPRDAATRMMLAYLLEARGDLNGSRDLWAILEDPSAPRPGLGAATGPAAP